MRSVTGTFVQLHHLVAGLLFLISASAQATDGVEPAPDFAVTQIQLTPSGSVTPIGFKVRLALTPFQHSYGLMFSPPLTTQSGMLFLFKDLKPRTFWMKNTPIALDMLFFDENGRLIALISNATPHSLTLRRSMVAAKYVLEIGGREADRLNLKIGSRLHLPIVIPENSPQSRRKVK
jgi:uncharacterized membrane protein (UPF0127 family)